MVMLAHFIDGGGTVSGVVLERPLRVGFSAFDLAIAVMGLGSLRESKGREAKDWLSFVAARCEIRERGCSLQCPATDCVTVSRYR